MARSLIGSTAWSLAACVIFTSGCSPSNTTVPAAPSPPVDLTALKQKAETGNVQAQQALGDAYATGQGTAPDYKMAAQWWTRAAEQNDAAAQYGLAQLFEAGQGVTHSFQEAATWYRKAAEQGHAGAQYALAVLYAFGRGVQMNDAEAAKWYLKAAEQGEPLAQFNIGQPYQAARGVPLDKVEAFKWLSLSQKEVPDAAGLLDDLKRQLSRQELAEAKSRIARFAVSSNQVTQPGR